MGMIRLDCLAGGLIGDDAKKVACKTANVDGYIKLELENQLRLRKPYLSICRPILVQ